MRRSQATEPVARAKTQPDAARRSQTKQQQQQPHPQQRSSSRSSSSSSQQHPPSAIRYITLIIETRAQPGRRATTTSGIVATVDGARSDQRPRQHQQRQRETLSVKTRSAALLVHQLHRDHGGDDPPCVRLTRPRTWTETRPHETATTRRRHRPPRTHNYEDHHDRPLRRLQRAGHARDCDIHLIHAGDATRRSCAETRHERRPRGGANDVGAEPVNTTVRGGGLSSAAQPQQFLSLPGLQHTAPDSTVGARRQGIWR